MNAPNDAEREKLADILATHVNQLMEHFENVQIFCSNVEEGGDNTATYIRGAGNWYARMGVVQEWIEYHKESVHVKCRKDEPES